MTNKNSAVELGKKSRAELNLPILSFEVADSWMDYLGYEQFGWWLKFHSWVNREESKYAENHIPYTLESVYKRLGISKVTFYRKIKVLWECGLIEIIEYEKAERNSQKPKNIIVYEYPFHEIARKYKPLEKLRDWKKDYDSFSKESGVKGALKRKAIAEEKRENKDGFKIETVEIKPVDNVDNHGFKTETVDGFKTETVTVSKLKPNNYTNKLLTNTNKYNNYTNNNLSLNIDGITDILSTFGFKEGEIKEIIKLIHEKGLSDVSNFDIISQAKFMWKRKGVRDRPTYFVKGLIKNFGGC